MIEFSGRRGQGDVVFLGALLSGARKLAISLSGALMAVAAVAARPPTPWDVLEARKASIGKIEVVIGDVFDLSNPEENTWLGRLADHLHAATREVVVRRVLLFAEGDKVQKRVIYETERLLRALPFVKDAHIDPVVQADGTVVAMVRVRDAWTTQVNAGYSQVGGQKSMNLGLDEKNFGGFGKDVALGFSQDPMRRTWELGYGDPQLFGSRWTLQAQAQHLSDGFVRSLQVEQPFYALLTPWSAGLGLMQKHSSLYFYDQGIQVYQAPFIQDEIRFSGALALHESGTRVWRGGLIFEDQNTSYGTVTQTAPAGALAPPSLADRRLRGPALTLSTAKDAYDSFVDLQGMDVPEDYNLAWTGELDLGIYSRSFGSSMTAPFFQVSTGSGWSSSSNDLILFAGSFRGRKPDTGLEDGLLDLSLTGYHKLTSDQIFAGMVTVDRAVRPDPEDWYYLGGDQGMRGFPNKMHPGDARWTTSFEYRLLTDQRWFGLVRMGYTAFVDLGSIHRLDGSGWSRTYSDVGLGLRMGNLKSSMGRVILVNLAVPLNREPNQNRWQITFGNAQRF